MIYYCYEILRLCRCHSLFLLEVKRMEVKFEGTFILNKENIDVNCPVLTQEGCLMAIVNLHEIFCEELDVINDETMNALYDIERYLNYVIDGQEFIAKEAQEHEEEREIYLREEISVQNNEEQGYRDVEYKGDVFLCDIMVVTYCLLTIVTNNNPDVLPVVIDTLKRFTEESMVN